SVGAVSGALLSGAFGDKLLTRLLAVVALAAAVASFRGRDETHAVADEDGDGDLGEHRGTLSGTFRAEGTVRRYRARNLPGGLAVMSLAGLVAGIAGASGGVIKTPAPSGGLRGAVEGAPSHTPLTVGV